MSTFAQQRIVVTGGAGFLGTQVCRLLRERGVPASRIFVPRRPTYDLTDRDDCRRMYQEAFDGAPVDLVIHLAAEVGGIGANQANPGRYFYANMAMALHLIEEFRIAGLIEHGSKFVQVGTICAYPKDTPVPFKEEAIFDGYPEVTNAPYGIAKRAAWQMLEAYRLQYGMRSSYVLPVNLYGPGDDFDLQTSHVIPALIRKCVAAQHAGAPFVEVWGTGTASREFLYVTDAAEGILRAAEVMDLPTPINLGTGEEVTIAELIELIASLTGFRGEVRWDSTKPDGQPRRCLDVTRARTLLDWRAQVPLRQGLTETITWWESHRSD